MSNTLAVDPGLRGCGITLGRAGRVVAAAYVVGETSSKAKRTDLWIPMVSAVWKWAREFDFWGSDGVLVIELPQVYKASHQRGRKVGTDPQDLIELAAVVGGITALCGVPARAYLPAEWKGQVPKEIMHDRARARLSPSELAAVETNLPRGSLAHNVWDAVSLFLRHVGRL
jgi:hypothetical protein